MILTGKEDLRVQKTVSAIYKAFEELLLEKDMEKITVTELASKARINKKTFYAYYHDLDELLEEMQRETAKAYVERVAKYTLPRDAREVIREFFLFSKEQGPLYEKITLGGHFYYIRQQMIKDVRHQTDTRDFTQTLPGVFMSATLLEIYKYWVESGKETPIEDIIADATALIIGGFEKYEKERSF